MRRRELGKRLTYLAIVGGAHFFYKANTGRGDLNIKMSLPVSISTTLWIQSYLSSLCKASVSLSRAAVRS